MDYGEGKNIVNRFIVLAWLIVSLISGPTGAEEIGRLFFSAEQRQILQQQRAAPLPLPPPETPAKAKSAVTAKQEPAESVPVTPPKITGKVLRSSGNNTVWLDHKPQYKRGWQ